VTPIARKWLITLTGKNSGRLGWLEYLTARTGLIYSMPRGKWETVLHASRRGI